MKIKTKPNEIYDEYEKGRSYNNSRDLYDTVEKNQSFYLGDQWKGVNAPDLTKPVFNIVKRVTSYFAAMIVSDDVGVSILPFNETEQNKVISDVIAKQVEAVLERTKANFKCRTNIKNCAVDGDTCMFVNFNPDIETNQDAKGDIELEIIDNTNVMFGNPYSEDVQSQPYILIIQRLFVGQVKDMAEAMGVPKDQIANIKADNETMTLTTTSSDELVTVITKFWKEKKEEVTGYDPITKQKIKRTRTSVHMTKCTHSVTLREPVDLGYTHYPIAYMTWEHVKNSYHGRSPITGLIPNQIFINKIYAMCMVYMTNMGFPKIFYDSTKLGKLSNDVTKAVALPNMDMAGKMIDAIKAPDFSNQIIQLVDSTISYTKDFMGASDAALGNISNPNNTSAIVAVQQASSVPLELQKLDYYQFYEDIVRAIVDVIANNYGIREVRITEEQAKKLNLLDSLDPMTGMPTYQTSMTLDFSTLLNMNYDIDVEIGASSYWSETTQVQTMDSLFEKGILTDPVMYLDGIPDKYIPNKQKIIEALKQQQAQMAMAQQMMQPVAPVGDPNVVDPNVTVGMQDGMDNRAPISDAGNQQLQDVYAASKDFYGGNA